MKKRIISAIIMIILFIPFLILGGNFYLVLGSVLGVLSLWEMLRLEKSIPSYNFCNVLSNSFSLKMF